MAKKVISPLQDGVFFTFIDASKDNKVKHQGIEYQEKTIISKITPESIGGILSSNETVKLLGISTDQQLYKPGKDVHVLITALGYPERSVKVTARKNGALWFDDTFQLSSVGVGTYKLENMDIGKYEVTANIDLENESIGVGTASFDVAVFELDPFQVIIESQAISSQQVLTANVDVSILHQPYSGKMKVGLFCAYCRQVVLRDEVSVKKGKATVSFSVGGHTAPFSLEFIIPERGYTAMIQLEGTMPHERVRTALSAGLKQNHQVSLFPETGSIAVQGVNLYLGDIDKEAIASVESIVGDKVTLKIEKSVDLLAISSYNPMSKAIVHNKTAPAKGGDVFTLPTGKSHIIEFFAGITSGILVEGFFTAFRSPEPIISLDVPPEVEAGGMLEVSLANPSTESPVADAILLVFDKRKTHSSLYKDIGKKMHAHLKTGMEYLPNRVKDNYMSRTTPPRVEKEEEMDDRIMEMKEYNVKRKSSPKAGFAKKMAVMDMAPVAAASLAPPSAPPPPPSGAPAPAPMPQPIAQGAPEQVEAAGRVAELFEEFEDVMRVEFLTLAPGERKVLNVPLADQITTWEVRLYGFRELGFDETVKDVSAVKKRFLQIRAPEIVDAENGDSAEIEIHYLADAAGELNILLKEKPLISPLKVKAGSGVIRANIASSGTIKATLTSDRAVMETIKQVRLPFEQKLVYTHMDCVYPGEEYSPPQEVQILPNPLPLIRESVHVLQGYPFGCAEQTSAKIGALALAYKYHVAIGSGEEVPLAGMIRQGMGRLFSTFFNNESLQFGLWTPETANEKVTMQVLANLLPLLPLVEKFQLEEYEKQLRQAAADLTKHEIKSFALTGYSPKFLPKREISDPLEAALALLSPDLASGIEQYTAVLEKTADRTETTCKWTSPLAWAGALQTTAVVLRALVRHSDALPDPVKKLYQKGFHFVMQNMINGRLFATTDTLALITLFVEIPRVDTRIKLDGKEIQISKPERVSTPFVARTMVYAHWVEEVWADPFRDLPPQSTKLSMKFDKTDCQVGDELELTIEAPEKMFCPVAAICLPPHLAMMKGGGNVQQHYLPFRESNELLLELACIRPGTGHVRVIVHDMYSKEEIIKPVPIAIKIR